MPIPYRPLLPALVLFAAAIILALISLPALNSPLMLDSTKLHALEKLIAEHGKSAIFHTPDFGVGLDRIVSMFSFVLNIQISESLSPLQIKATNIAIHIICSIFSFLFIRTLLRQTTHGEKATHIALIASLLWLLAPINFNTSIYAIQRMTQLSAFFSLFGLFLYTIGRLEKKGAIAWAYIGSAILICLPLAALSKENGVLLIAFLFLAEIYFINSVRPILKGRQLALIGCLGAAASMVALAHLFPGTVNYEHRDFTLTERLLSQARALVSYLQGIAFPYGSDIGLFSDDFEKSRSLLTPATTLLSLLMLIAIAVFCIMGYRRQTKLAAFGLAFFLVGHGIESTFIPLELYFPHRNYLPSFGVYIALAWLLVTYLPYRKWLITISTIILIYFSAISYARSLTWSSRENIIATSVYYHPSSPRALSNYAQLALEQGELNLAFAAVNQAINLSNTLNRHVQRLYILCEAGAEIADKEYEKLQSAERLGVSNELAQALSNLLALYKSSRCSQLQVDRLVSTLDIISERYQQNDVGPWTIEYYTAAFLYSAGEQALTHQRLQNRLDQGHPESGLYRAELLIMEGRIEEAERTLSQVAAQLDHNNRERLEPVLQEFIQKISELE